MREFKLLHVHTDELLDSSFYSVTVDLDADLPSGCRVNEAGCGGPPWPDDERRKGEADSWWRAAESWNERVRDSHAYRELRAGHLTVAGVYVGWTG